MFFDFLILSIVFSGDLETSFIVEFDSFDQINNAKNELQNNYENLTISLIDNNMNI